MVKSAERYADTMGVFQWWFMRIVQARTVVARPRVMKRNVRSTIFVHRRCGGAGASDGAGDGSDLGA